MHSKMPTSSRRALQRLANFVNQHKGVTLVDYIEYRRQNSDPIDTRERSQLMAGLTRSEYLSIMSEQRSNGALHGIIKRKDRRHYMAQ